VGGGGGGRGQAGDLHDPPPPGCFRDKPHFCFCKVHHDKIWPTMGIQLFAAMGHPQSFEIQGHFHMHSEPKPWAHISGVYLKIQNAHPVPEDNWCCSAGTRTKVGPLCKQATWLTVQARRFAAYIAWPSPSGRPLKCSFCFCFIFEGRAATKNETSSHPSKTLPPPSLPHHKVQKCNHLLPT